MHAIAFDGLEHSGKTSVIKEAEKELYKLGYDVVVDNPIKRTFRYLDFEERIEIYEKMDVKKLIDSYIESYRSLKSEVEESNDVEYLLDRGLFSTLMKILCIERDRLGTNEMDEYILSKMYEIGPIEDVVFVMEISGSKEEKFEKIKARHGNNFASPTFWPHIKNQIDVYEQYRQEIIDYLEKSGVKVYVIEEDPLDVVKKTVLNTLTDELDDF